MPQQAAQQGRAAIQGARSTAGSRSPEGRASSRSAILGVAGALLTAAAIACVLMTGSPSPPSANAPTSAVARATVSAALEPAQAAAPATDVAPALSPVAAPPPFAAPTPVAAPIPAPPSFPRFAEAAPAPPLNAPGQCEIGQVQQLALNLSATERSEVGNVVRIHSGSYVSPPIVLTRSVQTVTFPAPPGSRNSARVIIEQQNIGGSTFDDDANGITTEVERNIDAHRDLLLLRWTTQRC
jgi:hypothetical protein